MISQAGPYFSRVLEEMCEQKLAPTGTIPTNDTKMIFLGSGPDRGQSPVEWGQIPFVHPSTIHSSIPP